MRIGIAVNENSENSIIGMNAGRARFFMVFEGNNLIETIENPFRVGAGGAGFGVTKMLADKGVEKIVAGKFGPNFISAMNERDILFVEMKGTVKDFFEKK
jgi:predicted Fe-Mo cluster-binding NifX family protein